MNKKLLITGANGQLGKALAERFPNATSKTRQDLDITNMESLQSIDWSLYDFIINAAAYVNADHSETPEGRSVTWDVNAVGPANLTKIAIDNDICLIHFSSEYVFDGVQTNHNEREPFSPLSVYGESKSAGDIAASVAPKHYILRTSWVVGDGHNFVKTMKKLADLRIDPKVVNDQYGRLTFVSELVRAVDFIIEKTVEYGTYNVSNAGKIMSWAEIATRVFELAGHEPDRVAPILTDEYRKDKSHFAPRPTNSDMDLAKIQKTGFKSDDYEPLLVDYVKSLVLSSDDLVSR